MTIYSAALLLFLVIDPLGNIPVFLSVLQDIDPLRRKRIILIELLVALLAMVLFLFCGRYLLDLLNISDPSLSIAGGVILFLIAVRMIFPGTHSLTEEFDGEPFVFPLAIPFIAGPSAMATLFLISSREPDRWLDWLAALGIAWAAAAIILYFGIDWLHRIMGKKGLMAMTRLMGMLLTLIAVQMFMSGITMFPNIG